MELREVASPILRGSPWIGQTHVGAARSGRRTMHPHAHLAAPLLLHEVSRHGAAMIDPESDVRSPREQVRVSDGGEEFGWPLREAVIRFTASDFTYDTADPWSFPGAPLPPPLPADFSLLAVPMANIISTRFLLIPPGALKEHWREVYYRNCRKRSANFMKLLIDGKLEAFVCRDPISRKSKWHLVAQSKFVSIQLSHDDIELKHDLPVYFMPGELYVARVRAKNFSDISSESGQPKTFRANKPIRPDLKVIEELLRDFAAVAPEFHSVKEVTIWFEERYKSRTRTDHWKPYWTKVHVIPFLPKKDNGKRYLNPGRPRNS